ncbi:MAG: class I SAM-dependent methyltransferase [Gemmatimonadota bacterium]
MSQSHDTTQQLARSWDANANAWTRLVRSHGIESRRVATDAAIVDAISASSPKRVLDVGCGEGWLCRALADRGINAVGVDGSAALIESARALTGGEFHHLSYEKLAANPEQLGVASYDLIVCNFSLLHEELDQLLGSLSTMLEVSGALLIQTVHPWSARGTAAYTDGWRTESFSSYPEAFAQSMPWYYRTLGSWVEVLQHAGFAIEQIIEPAHPDTGDPLSLLIAAKPTLRGRVDD